MNLILVIDDERQMAQSLAAVLSVEGYEVVVAENGHEGLEKARRELPDVILCDVRMPGLDGYEVLQAIRHDPRTASTPFIFVTGSSEYEAFRRGMRLGADDFITKPFDPAEILESIETRLKKHDTIARKHETTLKLLRKNISFALPHELRTPLMNIMGYAEMMMMDHEAITPQQVYAMSETIFRAGQRLHRLFENVLIYAQMELISADPKQLEGLRHHLIPSAATLIRKQAEEIAERHGRDDDLVLELSDSGLIISEENLRKIIEELVDNAFKFSRAGTPVRIKTTREATSFAIYISDAGRGMTTEQIKSHGAYIQFERAVYEQQGVGLGLSIAHRLVEIHKGEFSIRSIPREGTLIQIRFPI